MLHTLQQKFTFGPKTQYFIKLKSGFLGPKFKYFIHLLMEQNCKKITFFGAKIQS